MRKSFISIVEQTTDVNALGRSYYTFCLETALTSVRQARMLVEGDPVDDDHELPAIERLLAEALRVS